MVRYCTKCGAEVCEHRAQFYKPPLSDLCSKCRREAIRKRNYAHLK